MAIKFGGAKRILFLVDRGNLGRQTEDEFANFEPPDDPRKFPTLYADIGSTQTDLLSFARTPVSLRYENGLVHGSSTC